jgi:acyl-CoA thioester hydrolase
MSHSFPVFHWPIRVYWEDTDAGGIVFYANYLKFFERARTEWLRHLGLGQQALRDQTGGVFVVSNAQLDFRRPARLDDQLVIHTQLVELGRASLLIHQQAHAMPQSSSNSPASSHTSNDTSDQTPDTLLCDGHIRVGWVQADSLKTQRIPQNIVQLLENTPQAVLPPPISWPL